MKFYLHVAELAGDIFDWTEIIDSENRARPAPQKQNQRKVRRDARRRAKR